MKKYAIVGVGGRSMMYTEAFLKTYTASSRLVAICDSNEGRLAMNIRQIKPVFGDIKSYKAQDFDTMIKEHRPDCVIVTTQDCHHDEYICRSLEAGCDVITEKPMTTDEHKCQRIVDTVKKTGRNVRVTFNYRYSPARSQIKQMLMEGLIGKVLSVNFLWHLNTNHGADYFRRWHSNKCNSGGLLVHKATHHFDLINWWLGSAPQTVFAQGKRTFYNSEQAKKLGLAEHGERCLTCKLSSHCNFYLDMRAFPTMKELYLDNEQYDGYIRDKCVFRDDIDIEDSIGVVCRYRNNVILTYSLNAFMPWEGYVVEINGTKGKIEQLCQECSYISGDGRVQGALKAEGTSLKVYPHFQTPYAVPVWRGEGAHSGGDVVLLEDIFGTPAPDPLRRAADYVQGAYSILLGIAANKSISTGKMILVDDLVKGLPDPDYVANVDNDDVIPFVSGVKFFDGNAQV